MNIQTNARFRMTSTYSHERLVYVATWSARKYAESVLLSTSITRSIREESPPRQINTAESFARPFFSSSAFNQQRLTIVPSSSNFVFYALPGHRFSRARHRRAATRLTRPNRSGNDPRPSSLTRDGGPILPEMPSEANHHRAVASIASSTKVEPWSDVHKRAKPYLGAAISIIPNYKSRLSPLNRSILG